MLLEGRGSCRRPPGAGEPFSGVSGKNMKRAAAPRPARVKIPAARVRQGDLVVYLISLTVEELIAEGFYSVDRLDPESDEGYQRLLNKGRAKKLADYVVDGLTDGDAFLPTSVLLATSSDIPFDEQGNAIDLDIAAIGPLNVVDGQHRLEGLRMAAEKDKRVLRFEVAVNLAVNVDFIAQMCHFLIVNTTQKSVDKAVGQRITARLTQALHVENIPTLPKWIYKTVRLGDTDKALQHVVYLNTTKGSPWENKIRMAGEDSPGKLSQSSFVDAVVKYVLTANNPLSSLKDFDKEKRVFLNYWCALAALLGQEDDSVLYRYNGVQLFCMFSVPFFMKCQNLRSYTVDTMKRLLGAVFDNMEGEYAGVGHSDWWTRGGQAGLMNRAALALVMQEMARALHRDDDDAPEVEL